MPTELLLRRLGGYQRDPRDATWWPRTPLTIAPDGRTVIIHLHGMGESLKALKRASRADLDLILEVEPVNGQPKPYFDGHRLTNAYHAMCSPTAGPR